jgi:hypothetical protein
VHVGHGVIEETRAALWRHTAAFGGASPHPSLQ